MFSSDPAKPAYTPQAYVHTKCLHYGPEVTNVVLNLLLSSNSYFGV